MEDGAIDQHFYLLKDFAGHTNKKTGVNFVAEMLEIQMFCFRAGWQLAAAHSAFDYIFNTTKKDKVCGLSLSGWTTYINNVIAGGIPPLGTSVTHK